MEQFQIIFLWLKEDLYFIEEHLKQKLLTRMQDNFSPRGAKEACRKEKLLQKW